jgi:hypothetical protein
MHGGATDELFDATMMFGDDVLRLRRKALESGALPFLASSSISCSIS